MRFPIVLEVERRRVVVVGGGRVAERKVAQLHAAGADVVVVAPEATATLRELAEAGEVNWLRGPFTSNFIDGAALVFAVTDDHALNDEVVTAARSAGVWAASAAGSQRDFITPASELLGNIGIAVWSGSPALSTRLRDVLAAVVDARWQRAADIFEQLRAHLAQAGTQSERAELWRRLVAGVPEQFDSDDAARAFVEDVIN